MTNLANLLAALAHHSPDHPLVFETEDGVIGAGYHVTELRQSLSTGMDCGGKVENWHEARLQLLDGPGKTHMTVAKFVSIVGKGMDALPDLAQSDVLVEFGHNNDGLTLLSLGAPERRGDRVVVPLGGARAVCKPSLRIPTPQTSPETCCA